MATVRFNYLQRFRQELRSVGFSKAEADKIVAKIRKNKDNDGCFERACRLEYNFAELVTCAFYWCDAPEGPDYWSDLHETLTIMGTK